MEGGVYLLLSIAIIPKTATIDTIPKMVTSSVDKDGKPLPSIEW